MRKEKLFTLLFCFALLLVGCQKEHEQVYQVRKIDEARTMYNKSQEQLGTNTLFKQFGLSVDWDSYREVNDSTFIVSTTQIARGNEGSKIIGNFELYFDLRNKSEGKGYIRYTLPWKEKGRADYIAYSFQGRVIVPKKSINSNQIVFKGSNSYYKTVVYAVKQNCPQGLYFDLANCFCNYPVFFPGDATPTYWVVQFEEDPFVSYFLAPLDGASSDGGDADVVAFPDYSWSGNDVFDPYHIINPNYDPNAGTGGNTGGGGTGSGDGSPTVDPSLETDDYLSPEQQQPLVNNKLCKQSFDFTQVVPADEDGPGWKESSLTGLTVNTISDSYFEAIWTTATTGTPIIGSNFNLEIGISGSRPSSQANAVVAEAANQAMHNVLKKYKYSATKKQMQLGTFPSIFATEMAAQLKKTYPEARVSTSLSGRTTPKLPITGTCL